jgi:nucleoside-diphosphate-sugar epimerase
VRALVTGAAGFVGSHLAEALAADGHPVRAVDCLTPYYEVEQKRANLSRVERAGCEVVAADLAEADLDELLAGVDTVFHQAAQPGVRASWRERFPSYVRDNIMATQRLLEAVRGDSVRRFVFASSSSVYGDAPTWPTREDAPTRPLSPYGVTKLAAEHLCSVYAVDRHLPVVSLRYFTVYGPRQRPDMAIHRMIEAALDGEAFPMFGDGSQVREFTFVEDVVRANILAATADVPPGTVINIGGGDAVPLARILELVARLTGRTLEIERRPVQPGDVMRTGASIELARRLLGWRPRVGLEDGLARQIQWHRERRLAAVGPSA